VNRTLTSADRLAELEKHLALYFTGFARTASEVAQEQLRLTPQRTSELKSMLDLVDEAESILTNQNRPISEFGRLIHESWKIKRTLTNKITNPTLDEIYEAGLSAGALGGKLLGAGGGGFMLFFVPPERRDALRQRLKKLLCIPFAFSTRGSHVVVYEPEHMYDEALANERSEIYADDGGSKRLSKVPG
jgi:D-glycero-alpha-D-manno-heptose-7-phosphate kinase